MTRDVPRPELSPTGREIDRDPDRDPERDAERKLDRDPDADLALDRDPAAGPDFGSDAGADLDVGSDLGPDDPRERQVGPYRLLRKLGEGETSTVYLAARADDQYRQRVAIKLIRPGMDSRQILSRFQQERQILASLSHPLIARLLDGGSTAAGQPYLVMEYVDGEPLDAHCEQAGLSVVQRLELFCRICEAVQFAHRNLVVHRDLKPGNILVDAEGTPKLVDFGIAKLIDPEQTISAAEPTATVARVMTPHYASPEQVRGKQISTASDVYSLGVVLYELLTGRRPYELTGHSLQEIERVVCDVAPPPPSSVVRGARRGRGPHRWPIDLDNIVGMAMRKEPERRYASAQELADDIRRCLERRPVLARRDTLGYLVASFVRRNTRAVAAAAIVLVSLVVGGIATTWQWRRAVAERSRAETQRLTAEEALRFIVELFNVPDSPIAVHDVTARELVKRGAQRLNDQPPARPEVRAALKHALGVVSRNIGDYQRAQVLLEEAVALRTAFPETGLELADSLYQLGSVDSDSGKPYLAEQLLHQALDIRERLLGPDAPSAADVLERLANNAGYNISQRQAEDYFRRAIEIRKRAFGANDLRVASTMAGLASLYSRFGHFAEAEVLLRDAMAIRDRTPEAARCQGSDHIVLYELGLLRYRQGHLGEAARAIDAALECLERVVGPDHIDVIDLGVARVVVWSAQGRYAEAEELARRGLRVRAARHGDGSPAVDNAQYHLAHVLYLRGELDEAEALAKESLQRRTAAYGRLHPSVADSTAGLADIRLAAGDAHGAESAYRDAIAIGEQTLGAEHPSVAAMMRGLAGALAGQGRIDDARPLAMRALDLERRRLPAGHPDIAATQVVLGTIDELGSRTAEASFRAALDSWRSALGPSHPDTARAESLLGDCLAQQQRTAQQPPTAEVLALLHHGAAVLQASLGDRHPETVRALERLARVERPASAPGAPVAPARSAKPVSNRR